MPVHVAAEQMVPSPPCLLHGFLLPNLASKRLVRKGDKCLLKKEYIYSPANAAHLDFMGICFSYSTGGNLFKSCK